MDLGRDRLECFARARLLPRQRCGDGPSRQAARRGAPSRRRPAAHEPGDARPLASHLRAADLAWLDALERAATLGDQEALRQLQRSLQDANERMEREMALAARVQASFMPRCLPEVSGWQLAVSLVPARLMSGDFYDAIRLPDGALAILIADVVDKGVGAALYMAMSCALLRAFVAEQPRRPELVCAAVNERLLEYAGAGQFVTAFLGMLDPISGALVYANAGHNPPVLLARGRGTAPHRHRPATGRDGRRKLAAQARRARAWRRAPALHRRHHRGRNGRPRAL